MVLRLFYLAFALVTFASQASAAIILDQFYVPINGGNLEAGVAGYNANQELAQTFTVGQFGTLAQVDMYFFRYSGTTGNLIADICNVNASGVPSATLATTQIVGTNVPTFPNQPTFYPMDFSSFNIAVIPGEHLAIVLHATAGGPVFSFLGDPHTTYNAGAAFEQVIGNHSWGPIIYADSDLGFETFVNVPEPVSIAFLAPAFLAAAAQRPTSRRR